MLAWKRVLVLIIPAFGVAHASVILENTIPAGSLFLQPPVLTGAAPVFGPGNQGVVLANGFTPALSAMLDQIRVVVDYQDILPLGITGRSPLLLSLLMDNSNSPGALIESWTVPVNPSDTTLTIIPVNSVLHPSLTAGKQYWVSVVPVDPVHTGIGWGLASSGYPGIQLPVAESLTGMNSGWLPTSLNLANEFSVSGTALGAAVPEPATLWTCAGVLLALAACAARKRIRN